MNIFEAYMSAVAGEGCELRRRQELIVKKVAFASDTCDVPTYVKEATTTETVRPGCRRV